MHVDYSKTLPAAGILLVTGLLGQLSCTLVTAEEHADTLEVGEPLQRLITELAREAIPYNYENEKKWGQTKDVVRGLYVKRAGWQIKTRRIMKPVNHGTWTKYRVELLDPQQQFQVRLDHIRNLPNNRLAFVLLCQARVRAFGRLSEWQQGVQLISLSAEADATVELTLQCDLATRLDTSTIPPGLAFDPIVRQADLHIQDFRMRQISQLEGPLVKVLSASVREVLEDEIEHRRAKLVAQINRQIDKRRDTLRLSFGELLAPATKPVKPSDSAGVSSDGT